MSYQTIHDIPRLDRPREKLIHYGPEKLSNSELLAILLRTGKKGEHVIDMSRKILQRFSAKGLHQTDVKELATFSGLGPAKACEIVACFELGKRLLKGKKAVLLFTPEEVFHALRDVLQHKKEYFVIFYLDVRNQEIKRQIISIGTLNANLVHPREVFEPAVRNVAAQIIIAHNHPSGDPEPTDEDIAVTMRLVQAGKILGIEVLDHVVVASEGWVSLKERGIVAH